MNHSAIAANAADLSHVRVRDRGVSEKCCADLLFGDGAVFGNVFEFGPARE